MKLNGPSPPYATERLTLRPLAPEDRGAYAAAPSDAVLDNQFETVLDIRFELDGDVLRFAVVRGDDQALVGEVLLKMASRDARQGEVGYIFNPSSWAAAISRSRRPAMLRVGFETIGFHRIFARLDASNAGSVDMVDHLDLRREAHLIQNDRFNGRCGDEYVYAMLNVERDERLSVA